MTSLLDTQKLNFLKEKSFFLREPRRQAMECKTKKLLKRVYKHGENSDIQALMEMREFTDPFLNRKIEFILGNRNPKYADCGIDILNFTHRFRDSDPRERVDEVALTFLFFISSGFTQQKFIRFINTPGSWTADTRWDQVYKIVVYCVFELLYKVQFGPKDIFSLDGLVVEINKGRLDAIRAFAKNLGIEFKNPSYPVERHCIDLDFHHNRLWGPYTWRMIHLMAECVAYRPSGATELWQDFMLHTFHRFLRCSKCMLKYNDLLQGEAEGLKKCSSEEYPLAWYRLHNLVNSSLGIPDYSESEFEKDREFFRAGLPK